MQTVFPKREESRTVSVNAQYIVLFKNHRDNTQVVNLAKHIYPGRVKYMQDAFKDATSVLPGYLFFDLKQSIPEHLHIALIFFLTRKRTSMLTFLRHK